MYLVMLGPPGAGKGTQADLLARKLGLLHVATGALFRRAVEEGTELGGVARRYMDAGELVPDDVVIGLVSERLQQPDAQAGVIFDGFPRTLKQAEALDAILIEHDTSLKAVLYLEVPTQALFERLSGRQRSDDIAETLQRRIEVYQQETAPLIHYYREQGLLVKIDGGQPIRDVYQDIIMALSVRHEDR